MELVDRPQWKNRLGRKDFISAAKQFRQKLWPLTYAGQRSCKPCGQTHFRNHHRISCWPRAQAAGKRLYYWTTLYSYNRDHTMACRPILCPAVKMKPYSVLCRPSVSLLKPKNKDWLQQNIFIALCFRCTWLQAERDLWKERAEPEKTQREAPRLTQGQWNRLNLLFRHMQDWGVKPTPSKKNLYWQNGLQYWYCD